MKDETTRRCWRGLASRHDARAQALLDAAYGEPQRAYHAWPHIDDMLRKLDARRRLAARPDLVAAAVFWHDAVYRTREGDRRPRPDRDNVRDSAALFRRHERFDPADAAAVEEMILATAGHAAARASGERYPGFGGDFDLFLDLDLSSLAAPWPVFAENLEKIRCEYAFVAEPEFSRERLAFLEGLARAPRLFRRGECAAEWNAPARANLARCVDELRAKVASLTAGG